MIFDKKYQLKTLNYALRKPTKTDKNRQKTDKKYRQKADKTDKMSVFKIRNSEKPTNVGSENWVSVAILGDNSILDHPRLFQLQGGDPFLQR